MRQRHRVALLHEPALLEPERAIRLVEDAGAFMRGPRDDYHALDRFAARTALEAAHLALETAIDTGDPRVLDAALDLATERVRWEALEHLEDDLASASGPIFASLTEITNRVRDCARSASPRLRMHTAKGLGPRAQRALKGEGDEVDAEAARIVVALTKDAHAQVRGAAREALGGAAPPAWPTFFVRDPLAAMPANEAAELRAPLDRAAEALERGVLKDAGPLAAAIAALPDELAAPILEAWIRTPYATGATSAEPLLERWLDLDPDGERTVAWLRTLRIDDGVLHAGQHLGAVLRGRSREQARAVALRVARLLPESRQTGARHNAEQLVEAAWPEEEDPTPLLEIAFGGSFAEAAALPEDERRATDASGLVRMALEAAPRFDALMDALVEAFLAGFPGRLACLSRAKERLVTHAHPRLRAHAEALLREGEGEPLGWALRYLADGGHDPAADPPVATFLSNAARDPRLRAAMMKVASLREPAKKALRDQLAAGELPPAEAISVAHTILSSGALEPEEWAVVRAARTELEDPRERASAAAATPAHDEWTPEDHAYVESVLSSSDEAAILSLALRWVKREEDEPALRALLDPVTERFPMVASILGVVRDKGGR